MKIKFEWEQISNFSRRSKVIGGWVLHSWGNRSESMVFIPDLNHEWELE